MADIPDEFLDEFEAGMFNARRASDWMDSHPEDKAEIERLMEANLSMEWAFAIADSGLAPDPSQWDHVTFDRSADGSWDVIITAGGNSVVIDAADSDETAADTIWGDFWFHVIDEYDIDYDKEVNSPGGRGE